MLPITEPTNHAKAPLASTPNGERRSATILMHRRTSNLSSGSGVHLLCLCDCLAQCDYDIKIVLAPVTSFGRIPFCRPDPVLAERGILLDWAGTVKLGPVYVSTRKAVWFKVIRRIGVSLKHRVSRFLGERRKPFPSDLGVPLNGAETKNIHDVVNAKNNDLIIAEYSSLAPVLEGCKSGRRAVLLHDLFSSRSMSFVNAELEPDHFAPSVEEECDRLKYADLCIHSSLVEANLLKQQLPEIEHIWMRPNIKRIPRERGDVPRVVFIGAGHGGNREALNLILNEIWPAVRPHVPYKLWIVGEISNWVVGAPDQVHCVSFLEDLSTLGAEETIGIAPMRVASGISIKIGTYLELGMRVLTFPETLEAYGDTLDGFVNSADTPDEFAKKLVEMLLNPEFDSSDSGEHLKVIQSRMCNKALLDYLHAPNT